MLEKIALIIITISAIYYLYHVTFKNKGCNCSSKGGCCNDKKK